MEVRKVDVHRAELILEDHIHMLAILGGVYDAAHVDRPRSLKKVRCYRSGRRGGFGNGTVYLAPDLIVGLVGKDCIEKRFELVRVEVVQIAGGEDG